VGPEAPLSAEQPEESREFEPGKSFRWPWWKVLIAGQMVSIMLTGTGVFSQLLTLRGCYIPTLQTFPVYILLTFYLVRLYCLRLKHKQKSIDVDSDRSPLTADVAHAAHGDVGEAAGMSVGKGHHASVNTSTTSLSSSSSSLSSASALSSSRVARQLSPFEVAPKPPLLTRIREAFQLVKPRYTSWYLYLLISICDVEGNYFVVKAYQYTTIASVQLLDSFNLLCVLILARFVLKTKFLTSQLIGAVLCILGVSLCVLSDMFANPDKERESNSGSTTRKIVGDMFVLISCVAYACSNVAQDYMVKKNEKKVLDELEQDNNHRNSQLDVTEGGQEPSRLVEAMEQLQTGAGNMPSQTLPGAVDSHVTEPTASILAEPKTQIEAQPQLSSSCHSMPLSSSSTSSPLVASDQPPQGEELDQEVVLDKILDQRWEFIGYLGLFGSLLSMVQGGLLERKQFAKTDFNDYKTDLYLLGFSCCQFVIYSSVPVLLLRGDSVVMNLNFLTADFFGLIAAVALFHNKLHGLYFGAFVLCVIGLLTYNLAGSNISPVSLIKSLLGCPVRQTRSRSSSSSSQDSEGADEVTFRENIITQYITRPGSLSDSDNLTSDGEPRLGSPARWRQGRGESGQLGNLAAAAAAAASGQFVTHGVTGILREQPESR